MLITRLVPFILSSPISILTLGGSYCVTRFSNESRAFQEHIAFFLLIAGCLLLILRTFVETQRSINDCVGHKAIDSENRTFWALGVGLIMGGVLVAAFLLRRVFEHAELVPAFCFLVTNGAFAVVVRLRRNTAAHEYHGTVVEVACLLSAIGYLIAKYGFHLVNGEFGLGLSFNAVLVQAFLFAFDEHFGQCKVVPPVALGTKTTPAPSGSKPKHKSVPRKTRR